MSTSPVCEDNIPNQSVDNLQISFEDVVNDLAKSIDKKIEDAMIRLNFKKMCDKQKEDSLIVRDLVFERFRDSFKKSYWNKIMPNGQYGNATSTPLPIKNNIIVHRAEVYEIDAEMSVDISMKKDEDIVCEEFDADQFLEDALGDELLTKYSTSTIYTNEDENQSVGTSRLSALISKAGSLYSIKSNNYCNSSFSHVHSAATMKIEEPKRSINISSIVSHENKVLNLIMERAIQEEIAEQIYKALNYCAKTKEFYASPEHVEAERALLASICRRELILCEISRLEYECIEKTFLNLGSVTINSIKFVPKQYTTFDTRKNFNQWFVCILRSDESMHASHAILADESGMVHFTELFKFENLFSDFEIELSLYSMRIRNNIRNYSHESKYHLKTKHRVCPSLKFRKKKRQTHMIPTIEERPSAFTLWGQAKIRLSNCAKSDYIEMYNVPRSSNLLNYVNLEISSSVDLEETREGFLTLGCKVQERIDWNRRWCFLSGSSFSYWNSPCEADTKEPIEVIDLTKCLNQTVTKVERSMCARPRTLFLDIVFENDVKKQNGPLPKSQYYIRRYFLATDTIEELKQWESSLNSIVSTLKDWHCIKV